MGIYPRIKDPHQEGDIKICIYMNRFITKIISLILIFNLLFIGGISPIVQVYGQSEPAPTSAPSAASLPKEAKPPSEEKPTSAPQATSAPTQKENTVVPTSVPQPTNNPESTTVPETSSPTPDLTPTGSMSESSNNSAGEDNIADQQNQGNNDMLDKTADGSAVNDPANIGTGPLSDNFASEVNKKTEEIVNNNLAQLQNKIDAISNSGFNFANFNTLQSQVFTGDSIASLNLLNKLNSNMTGLGGFSVFNVYDAQYGDIVFKFTDGSPVNSFVSSSPTVAKNSVTGPGSTNNALADDSFTVKEANGNDAQLVNDINLQAVTGENSASYNTGNGQIKTGDATALGNIVNLANTNLNVSQWLFGVVNIFGTLAGNIVLPQDSSNNTNNIANAPVFAGNTNTGPLSTNNAIYNDSATSNYTNNNTADVSTSLNVTANSGNNTSSVNTGGGSVQSGSSDASVSNTTIANVNTVQEEETVWMVIVNEAGKWVGHIIGAPWGATAASNSLPLVQTGGGSGTQTYSTLTENSATGPSSSNNATYNSTADTAVTNNNTASISNNITANSDTGNNNAEFNTGAGVIETGDAKTGLNLVNMVNTNVVAKKFVAILVNVMGNFLGDVVTPGQKSANQVASTNNNHASGNSTTNQLTPTLAPLPTATPYQAPQFTASSSNIGGISTSEDMVTFSQSDQNTEDTSNTSNYSNYQYEYAASVNRVNNRIVQTRKNAQAYIQGKPIASAVNSVLKRGVFVSPAFAKATETSFAGMLLGGATFKVNETWLTIIPFTLIFLALRRRKKIEFGKYLNAMLEIIL